MPQRAFCGRLIALLREERRHFGLEGAPRLCRVKDVVCEFHVFLDCVEGMELVKSGRGLWGEGRRTGGEVVEGDLDGECAIAASLSLSPMASRIRDWP